MMDESKRTPWAVIWAALLHIGLIGFLFLATMSCTAWEHMFTALDLPASWSPLTCNRPQALKGPVIQASLVGPSAAPLPPPAKATPNQTLPPLPKPSKPVIQQQKLKVPQIQTLAAPPQHPDIRNQQKVVAVATKKAKLAKRKQRQREKQRMSELQAKQQAEQQAKQQAKLNKIFQQLNQAQKASEQAAKQSNLEQQKLAQLKNLKKAKKKAATQPPGTKVAKKARSGSNGTAEDAYEAAIQSAVTKAWLRPDNISEGSVCPIHIVQIPGGQVISVTIEPGCPFDAAARRSVKNAVLRAQPLPYKGFEKEFRSNLTLNFKVTN